MSEPSRMHAIVHRWSGETLCGATKWLHDVRLRDIDAKRFKKSVVTAFLKHKYRCEKCAEVLSVLRKIRR